jgi:TatD family-associated radical SAM protein
MIEKSMTITYEVEDGLYINMTNRCSNACTFCIRNNGNGAYGSDSLWLLHEPTVDEILESVFARDLSAYKEVVFCGYGEPTYRIEDARTVALKIKERFPSMHIRMNTNGHSDLIHKKETAMLFEGAFDTVGISLNTPNAEEYVKICRPVFGEIAFDGLLKFAEKLKKYVPRVLLSVVRQTLTEEELNECRHIAERTGVELKIREYIAD